MFDSNRISLIGISGSKALDLWLDAVIAP